MARSGPEKEDLVPCSDAKLPFRNGRGSTADARVRLRNDANSGEGRYDSAIAVAAIAIAAIGVAAIVVAPGANVNRIHEIGSNG
jgi:hypothetical protein